MKRFLLRAAPLALMAVPAATYSTWHREAAAALDWRAHTYEARALAERALWAASCPSGPRPLAAAVAEFAAKTRDNPRQVEAARAMAAALARCGPDGPCPEVARLAAGAADEEARLLAIRTDVSAAALASTDRWARSLFLSGLAFGLFQAAFDWILRRVRPALSEVMRERDAKDAALRELNRVYLDARNLNKFLALKLTILEGRLDADRFGVGWQANIDDVREMLQSVAPPPPPAIAPDPGAHHA